MSQTKFRVGQMVEKINSAPSDRTEDGMRGRITEVDDHQVVVQQMDCIGRVIWGTDIAHHKLRVIDEKKTQGLSEGAFRSLQPGDLVERSMRGASSGDIPHGARGRITRVWDMREVNARVETQWETTNRTCVDWLRNNGHNLFNLIETAPVPPLSPKEREATIAKLQEEIREQVPFGLRKDLNNAASIALFRTKNEAEIRELQREMADMDSVKKLEQTLRLQDEDLARVAVVAVNPTKTMAAWGREVSRRLAQRAEQRRNIVMCQNEED